VYHRTGATPVRERARDWVVSPPADRENPKVMAETLRKYEQQGFRAFVIAMGAVLAIVVVVAVIIVATT
jgi:hypothetical protein